MGTTSSKSVPQMHREHALVRKARTALRDAETLQWAADRERERSGSARLRAVTPIAGAREVGVIFPDGNTVRIAVTPALRERSLALLDSLLHQFSEQGLTLWVDEERTFVGAGNKSRHLGQHTFELSISEIVAKATGAQRAESDRDWIATGNWCLDLKKGPSRNLRIKDEADCPVEHRLDVVVRHVVRGLREAAARGQREEELRVARDAERAAELRASAEREEAAAVERAREAEEVGRLEALYSEASAWRRAADVRAYVEAVLARAPGDGLGRSAIVTWAEWALQAADALDPIADRLRQYGSAEDKSEPPTEPDIGQTPSAEEEGDD
ncbi:hypothetical protein C7419_101667 [Cupriavidus plantarum]|uniref:Uncharacterized protein n=1 Tax=Cupriavidus plantarum TaxID=942865 RepID=A0A316FGK9_9BURK|nr:hypothetical protein C7419_101667 [Cupriavidus plantarum]